MSEESHALAMNRLVNWVLGVGSVVTGGLLLWIGSQTYELAKQQAVTAERVQSVQLSQQQNTTSINETGRVVREISSRVQRVEDNIDIERQRARDDSKR
jgi:hypothetical protein